MGRQITPMSTHLRVQSRRLGKTTCAYYWSPVRLRPEVSSTRIREASANEKDRIIEWLKPEIREDVWKFYQSQQQNRGSP